MQTWAGQRVRVVTDDVPGRAVGEVLIVVEPGAQRLRSVGMLSARRGGSRGRRRHGEAIIARARDGTIHEVLPAQVAPAGIDHPLVGVPGAAAEAAWLVDALRTSTRAPADEQPLRVSSLVPAGFPAVAAVLHPWTDEQVGADDPTRLAPWAAVARATGCTRGDLARSDPREATTLPGRWAPPAEGELPAQTAAALVAVLGRHTSTPQDVRVGVWEGYGDLPHELFPEAGFVHTPGRAHMLLAGPLEGVLVPASVVRVFARPLAGLWWPSDRAWVVHSEIDLSWTFVAGTEALVEDLCASDGLEVVRTRPDRPIDEWEDA